MIVFEDAVKEMLPLTVLERAFQYVYENRLPYEHADEIPEVKAILSADSNAERIASSIFNRLPSTQQLTEATMFRPDTDVLVSCHIRYHPAIEHCHDFFEIQYVLTGSFRQDIAGQEIQMNAGDFCFIAPNVPHNPYVFSNDCLFVNLLIRKGIFPHAFLNILSSSDLISNFFMRALYSEKSNPFLVNHTGGDENIRLLILRLIETQKSLSSYVPYLIRAQFEELFLYILKDHSRDFYSMTSSSRSQQKILDILSYIEANYNTVSLSVLSEKFNYNKSYLSRILQSYTGKSFSDIISDLRFEHARNLLLTTDQNIEDIILNIGYTDRTWFYREFKRRYGTTPAKYRRQNTSVWGNG
ncbi:MAG: AraC family transcriptional regulator [Lachnospiraceae bacterium]|nr:AraC family transcriptional regulator [Lachnospiraceae bacterium]